MQGKFISGIKTKKTLFYTILSVNLKKKNLLYFFYYSTVFSNLKTHRYEIGKNGSMLQYNMTIHLLYLKGITALMLFFFN